MIAGPYCVAMAEYNAWMNAKMYALCGSLSDVVRKKDHRAFFRSIHGTLHHILVCDQALLSSFSEEAAVEACEGDSHEDFDELRRQRGAVDLQLLQWSQRVSDGWLNTPSTYTHHEDGVVRTVTQGFWVVHMFNHQTHHRGQITTLLTQLGHDMGSTDLHMSVPLPRAGG